jgi:heme oxygenase (biliverdin-IX-beta and delta-forming)
MSELGSEARRFVRAHPHGVLSTLSKRLDGYPFGSITPFVTDHSGAPIILISTLAEHTKNIDADTRVSLIVHPCADDMQAAGRVTIVGQAMRLPEKSTLGPRYLRHVPNAEQYFGMHDFFFYRIEPTAIRYIGGFGKINWVEPASYCAPANQLADIESGILQHMNADHADALRDYCRRFHGQEADKAEMIGMDCDGFDVRADGKKLRFEFDEPVLDAVAARAALVKLAKEARA